MSADANKTGDRRERALPAASFGLLVVRARRVPGETEDDGAVRAIYE